MPSNRSILLITVAVALCSGCEAALWGNLGVLLVTVGIFMGTLGLGRSTTSQSNGSRGRSPETSTSSSHG